MASNMTKYATIALVAILAMGAFAAIILTGDSEAYDGPVDAAGNKISFSAIPASIVSTAPSITETLIAMGYTGKIIGVSNNCDAEIIQEMVDNEQVTRVGSYNNPNQEVILNLSADVIFIGDYNQNTRATYNNLKNAGMKIVMLYGGNTLGEVYLNIQIIGQVMNDAGNAQDLQQSMIQTFNEVKAKAAEATVKPKVMINLGYAWGLGSVYGAGVNTFGHDMIVMSNSTNVLASVSGWKMVTNELLQAPATNPQVVLVMVQGGVTANQSYYDNIMTTLQNDPIWQNTDAVLNGKVYLFSNSAASIGQRASPNLVEFSQLVLIFTHPELFDGLVLPKYIGNDYADLIESVW